MELFAGGFIPFRKSIVRGVEAGGTKGGQGDLPSVGKVETIDTGPCPGRPFRQIVDVLFTGRCAHSTPTDQLIAIEFQLYKN